jgi:hypothetical protein
MEIADSYVELYDGQAIADEVIKCSGVALSPIQLLPFPIDWQA